MEDISLKCKILIMRKQIVSIKKAVLNKLGIDIIKIRKTSSNEIFPVDFEESDIRIIKKVKPYTYTSSERIYAFSNAVKYIIGNKIPGSIVECGVWKGGSAMAAMYTLINLGIQDRDFYLYDTYEGMAEPSEFDVSINGQFASELFKQKQETGEKWVYSSLDEVKNNVYATGYEKKKINFVKGKVEDTLSKNVPGEIAILRLDTDWYESTLCELHYLFPKLSKGGVIIIDDYGHWEGSKKAVDEYIHDHNIPLLLSRIDYTGRMAIKVN